MEVLATVGKAGSAEAASVEATSRLISLALRAGIDAADVIRQLRGITDSPTYDGGRQILSVPDAIAQVLDDVVNGEQQVYEKHEQTWTEEYLSSLCPDCSSPTTFESGCETCYACGWSKC